MAKEQPVCGKCGKSHWHFNPCANVADKRHASHERVTRAQQHLKAPEGFHVWGDRLNNVERLGENTFVFPHKLVRRNKLTYPKGT